jgi:hypothetical protein
MWPRTRKEHHGCYADIAADFGKNGRAFNLPKFIPFVDYEKAYYILNREQLWQILTGESTSTQILKAM